NARMQYGDVAATLANIDKMQPLQPLSEEAHKNAVVSWGQGVKGWGIDAAVCKPIYHWAAGLPRLLLESHSKFSGTMSLANGSVKAVHRCFGEFQKRASSLYEIRPEWFPYAVSCLLISSTKLKVSNPDNRIPINPDWKKFLGVSWGEGGTFRQAAGHSIGSYNSKDELFVVPPIIFSDDVMKSLMVEDCGNGKMKKVQHTLILPSQLHPYFTEAVAEQLGRSSPTERGKQFEKPFLYAVYARYLLAYWGNTDSKWVPLTQVFEGAFQQQQEDVMKGYEVNLSGGVHVALTELLYSNAVPNAITYFGSSAHHDAYIYCRTVDDGSGVVWEGAVPLQLRHGRPKSYDELKPQLMTIRVPKLGKQKKSDEGTKAPPAPQPEPVRLLLSVNHKQRDPIRDEEKIVMIDADKMSSIAWLWLLAPGEQ
ncbi:Bodo-specific multi-copy gene family, putative, partial [Bodo saltans]